MRCQGYTHGTRGAARFVANDGAQIDGLIAGVDAALDNQAGSLRLLDLLIGQIQLEDLQRSGCSHFAVHG